MLTILRKPWNHRKFQLNFQAPSKGFEALQRCETSRNFTSCLTLARWLVSETEKMSSPESEVNWKEKNCQEWWKMRNLEKISRKVSNDFLSRFDALMSLDGAKEKVVRQQKLWLLDWTTERDEFNQIEWSSWIVFLPRSFHSVVSPHTLKL